MTDRQLPEYDAPPVDEVALGVTFAPIQNFKVPHFGLYWGTIRGTYPRCDAQPPLPTQLEPFQPTAGVSLQLSSDPNFVRSWFLDQGGNNLIQLQPDKFIRNWRQVGDDGKVQIYPRYANLRPDFEREWNHFLAFLGANEFDAPRVMQCEVTYINNLEQGIAWNTFADLRKIAIFWNGMPLDSFLSAPESANIGLAYAMEKPPDHLRVTFQHALRVRDGKQVLQINLVCRMKLAEEGADNLMASFDRGHDWIVRAFTDCTTPEMHELWKRRV